MFDGAFFFDVNLKQKNNEYPCRNKRFRKNWKDFS